MIIVKLRGGLGNQMFQYAYGKALSIKTGITVKFDANYYFNEEFQRSDTPRKYLLDKFNTDISLATQEEVNKANPLWKKVIRKMKNKIFRYTNIYKFSESEFKIKEGNLALGYWQTEKYFKNIESIIRENFTLKNSLAESAQKIENLIIQTKKENKVPVSIHVRRSDYVNIKSNKDFFNVCDVEYYKNAFSEITKLINSPVSLFIFSDDTAWVKENLRFPCETYFVSEEKNIFDYEEIILMSKCSHNIIANSSFSWWGAWLNPNKNKIIMAPKKWVNDSKIDTSDVTPVEWVTI